MRVLLKKFFLPDEFVKNIFHITPEKLKERNVKGIITDLDNTLVEWDRPNATPRLIEWFEEMKEHGIKVTIVSNNNERRVKLFSEPLGIPFIYKARKPMGKAFNRAVRNMEPEKRGLRCHRRPAADRCTRGKPKRLPYDFGRASRFL